MASRRAQEADRAWHLVVATLALTGALSLWDALSGPYEVPGELYPMVGLVIGAALARLGGANDIGR